MKNRAKRQPCDTGLDERVQASVVGKVLDYNPRAARILNNYFEVFSWIALILLVVSGVSMGMGVYNYAVHGNCNGPNSDEGCAANTIEEKLEQLDDEPSMNKTGAPNETTEGVPG